MLRRFRNACPEARMRMAVGVILVLIAAGMGYVDRNPQQVGSALPGQILTLTAQASDCGRVALLASGSGCGGERRVGGITFLSASKSK